MWGAKKGRGERRWTRARYEGREKAKGLSERGGDGGEMIEGEGWRTMTGNINGEWGKLYEGRERCESA